MSRSRARAGLAAAAITGLAVLGVQAPASAADPVCPVGQHYAPGSGCVADPISADQRTYAPGEAGSLTASGFAAGSTSSLDLFSTPQHLASPVADDGGVVHATFTIPSSTPGGDHHLVLSGVGSDGKPVSLSLAIKIAAASGGSGGDVADDGDSTPVVSGSSLPRTGAEVGALAVVGLTLIGGGAGAVYVGRRRPAAA